MSNVTSLRPKQKLVVIGNGMAPGRALEKLFDLAPNAYDVTIFNAEPRVNYDRIMLSPVLSGEKTFDQIVIHGDGWYVKHGVTLYKGATVTEIDRTAKTVTTARGITCPDRHWQVSCLTAISTTCRRCCWRRSRAAAPSSSAVVSLVWKPPSA
jgi:NAD(P)H-nitrite reductase large subunit